MSNDVLTLLRLLRHRAWIVVGAVAAVVLGAFLYLGSVEPTYRAESVVAFEPTTRVNPSADLVRLVVGSKYAEYATSSTALGKVGRAVDTDPAVLERGVEVTLPTNSATLEVAVELPSPDGAADAADAVADELVAVSRNDPLVRGSVVAPAEVPDAAAGPSDAIVLAGAAFLGLAAGVALALLAEQLRPRLRSADEIARVAGVPVVGSLPRSSVASGPPHAALHDADFGRQLRILRANLTGRSSRDPLVLAVVSPRDGDGRTTVALHLAAAVAATDVRVLLIDADVHDPSISERLELSTPARGVATTHVDDVAVDHDDVPKLSVLGYGRDELGDVPPGRVETMYKQALDSHDLVIVDTPPLLSSDEARTLAAAADGVLVVTALHRPAADLHDTVAALRMLGADTVGVVVNRGVRAGGRSRR